MTTRTTAPRKGHYVLIEAGQVAVVTGAAQGLGRALAAGLIDCGVSVVLADTATERLQTTAEEFTRPRRASVAGDHRCQRRGGC
jgi:NADP-dependent 3-hydroxy acid dehydrogenase YdfG